MEDITKCKDELVADIIDLEWEMFQNINTGKARASCQDDFATFTIMRGAQFEAWSLEALEPYQESLTQAVESGRNIVALKYIYMMKSTDPDGYRDFQNVLPIISEENLVIIGEIMDVLMLQTKNLAERYPAVFRNSRSIESGDEAGWPSIETYQRCELMTYPGETLRELKTMIEIRSRSGRSYPEQVLENTARLYGFASLSDAEASQQ